MTEVSWRHEFFSAFGKVFVSSRKNGTTAVKVRNAKGELRFIVTKTGRIRFVSCKNT